MNHYDRLYTILVNEGRIATAATELVKAGGEGLVKGTRVVSTALRATGQAMRRHDIEGGKGVEAAGTIAPRIAKKFKKIKSAITRAKSTPLSDQPTAREKK